MQVASQKKKANKILHWCELLNICNASYKILEQI